MKTSLQTASSSPRINQQGFTLPEVLITIVILGILFAIASSSWLSLVESRRVTAATNQLAADMRLAHSKSVNGLASWRVILVPGRVAEGAGPDYFLTRVDSAGNPEAGTEIPRILPETGQISPGFSDDPAISTLYSVLLGGVVTTRSVEFGADGSMDNYSGAGAERDTIRVTQDGSPSGTVQFNEQTSRIRVG